MGKISRFRGETITLATSRGFATVLGIPPGFNAVEVDAPSATIEAILVAFGPKIKHVLFYDASVPQWRDVTAEAIDRNTASRIDLSEMQTGDRLYVCTALRCEGWSVNVEGTNGAGTASGVWEYPNGQAWTSLSATQTGIRSAAVFDQDGLVTWTVPTTGGWKARKLADVADEPLAPPDTMPGYWVRVRTDAAFTDTSVTISELTALFSDSLNTLTGETEGQDEIRIVSHNGGLSPYRIYPDLDKYGSIELLSTSITSAANINWLRED